MIKLVVLVFLTAAIGCRSRLSTLPNQVSAPAPLGTPTTTFAGVLPITPQNTDITFIGSALLASHQGTFTQFVGQLDCPDDHPADAHLSLKIQMDSVFTQIPLLTKHLIGSEFFDAAKYPAASFVSTRIAPGGSVGDNCIISGDLTLHGITRSISFPSNFTIEPSRITLSATITIQQSDFAMESARITDDSVPVNVLVRLAR